MKRFEKQLERTIQQNGPKLRLRPIAAAISGLLLVSGGVNAQQAASKSGDVPSTTIVVTGIARSIETSVAIKRNSDSIVEAVSAEDLGKLPDMSIAESLARLPGLTAQRVDGRASEISIRGMSPKFGVTLLNGREMVSTAYGRSVEFDQFPSELLNGATVYKTPDAALGTQGLSGTMNLQTIRPLDSRGRQANINVRAEHNSNGQLVDIGGNGSRISASYVDQFADNTIGVALGFAHLDSPNQQKYVNNWWWGNSAIWWGAFRGLENADPAKAPATLQGFEAGLSSTSTVRDGLMAVLEYKPSKDFRSQVDLYYSKFDQKASGREFQANLMPDWSGDGTPANPATGGPIYSNVKTALVNGEAIATSGAISNLDPYVVMRYNKREDKIFSLGWNNELKLGKWTTVADLSYSKADRDELKGELTLSPTVRSGFSSFVVDPATGLQSITPSLNFADRTVLQLRGINDWGSLNGQPKAGGSSPVNVKDDIKSLRLSAKRELEGIFSNFEGGLNYSQRSKEHNATEVTYMLKNGVQCIGADDRCAPVPANLLQSPVALGSIGVPSLLSFDFMNAINSGIYNSGVWRANDSPGRIWGVDEKVTTIFGKLGLEFETAIPIRGNVGVQIVNADQNSSGMAWDSKNLKSVPLSGGTSYSDVLPSLNLIGDLGSNAYARLGYARVMARPNMEDMRAGFSDISVATTGPKAGKWSANGGNPNLKPWLANALDLSVEKYFGKRSYVAAASFRKDLKTSVYTDTISYDFSGFPNPTNVAPVSNIGELNAPTNGVGGYIKGTEFSAALEGGLLHPMLDGFGVILSESKTNSDVPGSKSEAGAALRKPIEGLSGTVDSFVLYYEKHGFQARIAQRYRSAFRAETRGVWVDTAIASIEAEKITDLQLGYSFDSGPMKGVSILFQINNLDDTPYRTMSQDDSSATDPKRMMPEKYYTYGRQYLLGINYKF